MTQDLLFFNERGLIPGPNESENDFWKRVEVSHDDATDREVPLFEIRPTWVKIVYENKGLRPWEAAVTWIDQQGVTIQLRKVFLRKSSFLWLYKKDEILAHELAHAARAAFEEPKYEEWLAYRTSKNLVQAFLGSLVETPREVILFIATLPILGLPLLLFALGRSVRKELIGSRALQKIAMIYGKDRSVAFLFRLSDAEIEMFAKRDKEEIMTYIEKQDSLRWKMIKTVFACKPGKFLALQM